MSLRHGRAADVFVCHLSRPAGAVPIVPYRLLESTVPGTPCSSSLRRHGRDVFHCLAGYNTPHMSCGPSAHYPYQVSNMRARPAGLSLGHIRSRRSCELALTNLLVSPFARCTAPDPAGHHRITAWTAEECSHVLPRSYQRALRVVPLLHDSHELSGTLPGHGMRRVRRGAFRVSSGTPHTA